MLSTQSINKEDKSRFSSICSTTSSLLGRSNPFFNLEDTHEFEGDKDIDKEESYQFYTVPIHQSPKTPINVIDADYGVFEPTKKKKNILKGLFKRQPTTKWEDDIYDDPRMKLKAEPELVSMRSKNSALNRMGLLIPNLNSVNDEQEYEEEEESEEGEDLAPNDTLQHVKRRRHRFFDNRGFLNEYTEENIVTKSREKQRRQHDNDIELTKIAAQYDYLNSRKAEKEKIYVQRREQAKRMQDYERFFVNGMDKQTSSSISKLKNKSRFPFSKSKSKSGSKSRSDSDLTSVPIPSISDSVTETGESFQRFLTSVQQSFGSNFRDNLMCAETASEIHSCVTNCISSLPFGNFAAVIFLILGKFIPKTKSREGSYAGTFIAILSSLTLLTFCMICYRIGAYVWGVIKIFFRIAGYLNITV